MVGQIHGMLSKLKNKGKSQSAERLAEAPKDPMSPFFQQLGEVGLLIEDLKEDVKRIPALVKSILRKQIPNEDHCQQYNEISSNVHKLGETISTKLNAILEEIEKEEKETPNERSVRMKGSLHSLMLGQFKEVRDECEEELLSFHDRAVARLKRQLDLTDIDYTDEDIEEMFVSGNFSIFTQGVQFHGTPLINFVGKEMFGR